MKRRIFSVRWRRELGVWTLESGREILGHYRLKAEAVIAGRLLGAAEVPAQLRVYGRNGRIQFEHTYGSDPRRHVG